MLCWRSKKRPKSFVKRSWLRSHSFWSQSIKQLKRKMFFNMHVWTGVRNTHTHTHTPHTHTHTLTYTSRSRVQRLNTKPNLTKLEFLIISKQQAPRKLIVTKIFSVLQRSYIKQKLWSALKQWKIQCYYLLKVLLWFYMRQSCICFEQNDNEESKSGVTNRRNMLTHSERELV